MTNAINLNPGVAIRNIFNNLNAEQIAKVEEAAKDGFSEDELQKLEDEGIDTNIIKQNAAPANTGNKADVADKAKEINAKYCANLAAAQGDKYSASNPELKAMSKAMEDGLIAELGKEGYSKNEIVDIINQAFPNVGIHNNQDGSYECPWGHGDEAKAIYAKFVEELTKASSANSAELLEAQNKLLQINKAITNNNRELKSLECNITLLQSSIEDKIDEALDKSKDIQEDQKDDAKDIVSKRLNEYTSSNGDITYDEFQKNVASDLDNLSGTANSKLSAAVAEILSAQKDMNVLNGYLSRMNNLVNANKDLSQQASDVTKSIEQIKEKAASESDEGCKRCDPIGFTDEEGVRYDFFVDEDNDGNVTNENEFLGAENGFNEMINADADGDKKVTAKELDEKNVKVVVTKADGTQEIKNASDVLKESDSVDLSSYKAQNTEMDNGNALLGTFSVNMGGKSLDTGYQTMDTLDWLDDNFEFSDEINGTGRHTRKENETVEALDYSQKYNMFAQKYDELESKEKEAETKLKISSNNDAVKSMAEKEAKAKGSEIESKFNDVKKETQKQEAVEEEKKLEKQEEE